MSNLFIRGNRCYYPIDPTLSGIVAFISRSPLNSASEYWFWQKLLESLRVGEESIPASRFYPFGGTDDIIVEGREKAFPNLVYQFFEKADQSRVGLADYVVVHGLGEENRFGLKNPTVKGKAQLLISHQ